jgi:hypothetical protein
MEKDLGKIKKNDETEIVLRLDDFGGKRGLTIREFVTSERYTGFTKSGTRIPAEQFEVFKAMISEVTPEDLKASEEPAQEKLPENKPEATEKNDSGIDESGLM